MKSIKDYMNLPYRFEIIPDLDEGGYVIRYPDLPGCISSGDTISEAIDNGEDAKRAWFAAAIEDGIQIAEPRSSDEYSGQFKLRIPKTLHRALAEHARTEGISMNQYCLYLLTRNDSLEFN